ncbi:hypothetical protein PPO43_13810 [Saprospira sp. CCB-QB6]|uniref:hypothetical protein n=1 Tax=Saprospira sp. CCB-QB6 TaxID=3023936 RepID=UPI00234ACAFA|nr:hypothetical protein [Saprospira sp. CCB-QB6]WCL81045.1 hypothetical protein PPO43_13810 [Saprospira sp. CCB-QB6]
MRTIYLFLFCLCLSTYNYAQDGALKAPSGQDRSVPQYEGYPDLVILKNGSELRCKIIDYGKGGNIRVEIEGGTKLVYPLKDVARIERPLLRANNGGGEDQSDSSYTNRSYFFVNFGFPGSITEDAGPSIGAYMQFSGGWAMNPHLMLGGGFSMVRMTNGFIPTSHVPVFAEIRGDFKTKRPWAFTYSLALGYDIAILDTTVTTSVWTANDRQMLAAKGGLYIRPELGIRFAGKKSIRWHMGFGYQVIRASYEMNINNTFLKTEQWMIRPHLSVGILF